MKTTKFAALGMLMVFAATIFFPSCEDRTEGWLTNRNKNTMVHDTVTIMLPGHTDTIRIEIEKPMWKNRTIVAERLVSKGTVWDVLWNRQRHSLTIEYTFDDGTKEIEPIYLVFPAIFAFHHNQMIGLPKAKWDTVAVVNTSPIARTQQGNTFQVSTNFYVTLFKTGIITGANELTQECSSTIADVQYKDEFLTVDIPGLTVSWSQVSNQINAPVKENGIDIKPEPISVKYAEGSNNAASNITVKFANGENGGTPGKTVVRIDVVSQDYDITKISDTQGGYNGWNNVDTLWSDGSHTYGREDFQTGFRINVPQNWEETVNEAKFNGIVTENPSIIGLTISAGSNLKKLAFSLVFDNQIPSKFKQPSFTVDQTGNTIANADQGETKVKVNEIKVAFSETKGYSQSCSAKATFLYTPDDEDIQKTKEHGGACFWIDGSNGLHSGSVIIKGGKIVLMEKGSVLETWNLAAISLTAGEKLVGYLGANGKYRIGTSSSNSREDHDIRVDSKVDSDYTFFSQSKKTMAGVQKAKSSHIGGTTTKVNGKVVNEAHLSSGTIGSASIDIYNTY